MIALIIGGAPSNWSDLAAAETLLAGRRRIIVAANEAGIQYPGHLDAWASLHAEHLDRWAAERGTPAGRTFSPVRLGRTPVETVPERWNGSSGLYALQIAMTQLGATASMLCGVPMDQAAGHFLTPGPWAPTATYRQGFAQALAAYGGRIRSMGGWTAQAFGRPTAAWLDALHTLKPLGSTSPQNGIRPMHTVKNVSDTTQRFNAIRPQGGFELVRLAPGEGATVEIDSRQPRFNGGALKVEAVIEAAAEVAAEPVAAETKPKSKAKAVEPAPLSEEPADSIA